MAVTKYTSGTTIKVPNAPYIIETQCRIKNWYKTTINDIWSSGQNIDLLKSILRNILLTKTD